MSRASVSRDWRVGAGLLSLVALLGAGLGGNLAADEGSEPQVVPAERRSSPDFEAEVAPILKACLSCHGEAEAQGGVTLTTLDALLDSEIVVPGEPAESSLISILSPRANGARPRMPKGKDPLKPEQVDLLRRWIADGARWPEGLVLESRPKADQSWWSLQPLTKAEPPNPAAAGARPEGHSPVDLSAWDVHPIDRFVLAALDANGLTPSPPADRATLLRRLTYDLTGLPPTPEEVRDFLADPAPDAYERVVDRLLASPAYGEHWGRHWLDVVRFGESKGYEQNHVVDNAWPFRDYVIQSLNDDKPFDRLIAEHLAGDVLGPDDPAVAVGTAFLVSGPYDAVTNLDAAQAAQIRADTLDDMIRTTGEAFLGLTVGCARCHDHKFDPIAQADYYRLSATFAGVAHGERAIGTAADAPKWWVGQFTQPAEPSYVYRGGDPRKKAQEVRASSLSFLNGVTASYELPTDAPEAERRLALARWLTAADNPLTPRVLVNRVWQNHFGEGLVTTPSDFGLMGSPPTHPELLDWLARQLVAGGWRLKPLHRQIVLSQTYRQSSQFRDDAARADGSVQWLWRFRPRRLTAEELRDSMLAISGQLASEPRGGPGFRLYRYEQDNVATFYPLDQHGPETYRRAIYHQNARATRIDLLSEFDCPDNAFSAPRRASTTSPLQALTLLNHAFTIDMATALAQRLEAAEPEPEAQVALAYRLAYARDPAEEEREQAVAFVREQGLRAFARALLNSNELLFVR